eukprot:Rhum_TRINITY_DN16876_c0_g1::Rhum_TRINITY_DN16876_c0_g1_i1::g.164685::m.164685
MHKLINSRLTLDAQHLAALRLEHLPRAGGNHPTRRLALGLLGTLLFLCKLGVVAHHVLRRLAFAHVAALHVQHRLVHLVHELLERVVTVPVRIRRLALCLGAERRHAAVHVGRATLALDAELRLLVHLVRDFLLLAGTQTDKVLSTCRKLVQDGGLIHLLVGGDRVDLRVLARQHKVAVGGRHGVVRNVSVVPVLQHDFARALDVRLAATEQLSLLLRKRSDDFVELPVRLGDVVQLAQPVRTAAVVDDLARPDDVRKMLNLGGAAQRRLRGGRVADDNTRAVDHLDVPLQGDLLRRGRDTGRVAGAHHALPLQRVDHRRLSDVGEPDDADGDATASAALGLLELLARLEQLVHAPVRRVLAVLRVARLVGGRKPALRCAEGNDGEPLDAEVLHPLLDVLLRHQVHLVQHEHELLPPLELRVDRALDVGQAAPERVTGVQHLQEHVGNLDDLLELLPEPLLRVLLRPVELEVEVRRPHRHQLLLRLELVPARRRVQHHRSELTTLLSVVVSRRLRRLVDLHAVVVCALVRVRRRRLAGVDGLTRVVAHALVRTEAALILLLDLTLHLLPVRAQLGEPQLPGLLSHDGQHSTLPLRAATALSLVALPARPAMASGHCVVW